MALKAENPAIKIAITDPMGSALYDWYKRGELHSEGTSITEGIGQGRVTGNLEGAPIDFAYQVTDEEALPIVFDLAEHEGLLLGGSSGINIAGAMRLARELGPGHTIVTILCDGPARAISRSSSTRPSCARRTCRASALRSAGLARPCAYWPMIAEDRSDGLGSVDDGNHLANAVVLICLYMYDRRAWPPLCVSLVMRVRTPACVFATLTIKRGRRHNRRIRDPCERCS